MYIVWKSTIDISLLGCCPWSLRHFTHPILKEFGHVLCKHTKVHFYLCYKQKTLSSGLSFNWFFIEFITKCYKQFKTHQNTPEIFQNVNVKFLKLNGNLSNFLLMNFKIFIANDSIGYNYVFLKLEEYSDNGQRTQFHIRSNISRNI